MQINDIRKIIIDLENHTGAINSKKDYTYTDIAKRDYFISIPLYFASIDMCNNLSNNQRAFLYTKLLFIVAENIYTKNRSYIIRQIWRRLYERQTRLYIDKSEEWLEAIRLFRLVFRKGVYPSQIYYNLIRNVMTLGVDIHTMIRLVGRFKDKDIVEALDEIK